MLVGDREGHGSTLAAPISPGEAAPCRQEQRAGVEVVGPELLMTSYVAPVPIELPAGSRLTRARRRARTVATFGSHLVPVVVRRVVGRPPASDQVARRLRRSFEALGSTYVKFGQLVGSSPGAFGPAVADEFRSCLDTGPAVAFGQVRAAVERAAGRPLAEVYRSFDETPAASASIAV